MNPTSLGIFPYTLFSVFLFDIIILMVRLAGIEPACPWARDFKSLVSTYFTTVANLLPLKNNITPYGMERISEWSSILLISHCSRFYQRSKMALFLMSLCVHKRYPLMLFFNGAPTETRTRMPKQWLLRPPCLPIPPSGQFLTNNLYYILFDAVSQQLYWRKRWDSNSRYLAVRQFSRLLP